MNDKELLSLLMDPESRNRAFRFLVEKYQERIYWHVRKMVYQHDDANDIVQDTFVKAYKAMDNFKGQATLYTWLYRIATNESLTFLKKAKRVQKGTLEAASQLASDPYFDGEHAQFLLQKSLATLPDKQRMVFNMRYFEEMPYQQISEILGTSVGALKANFHHAVKKIEQSLKNVEI